MAIGKVGTYATTEPALVDFGSMAERNIDKIAAQEEARRRQKALEDKAKRDAAKDVKEPGIAKTTGIGLYDSNMAAKVKELYNQFSDLKAAGNVNEATRVARVINTLAENTEFVAESMKTMQDRINGKDDINPEAYNIAINYLRNLGEDKIKLSFDGDVPKISVMGEDGEFPEPTNFVDFMQGITNLPGNYDQIKDINSVLDTIYASKTQSGDKFNHKTITDIESEESANQVKALKTEAKLRASQDAPMFSWYNAVKVREGKHPKVSGWTENERKEAEEYYFNTFKDAYNKEVELGGMRQGASGGGRSKEATEAPSILDPGQKFKTTAVTDLLAEGGHSRVVQDKGGKDIEVGGMKLSQIYVNKKGDLVFELARPISSSIGASGGGQSNKEADFVYYTPGQEGYAQIKQKAINLAKVSTTEGLVNWVRGEQQAELD